MKILAIDASTEACSAALLLDGDCQQRYAVEPRRHTELLLPMVDDLLSEAGLTLAQLDGIAFDRGPGAFTGVRVSTSVAQGLAFSVDLPVAPVSSLAALAQAAWRERQHEQVLSLIDARMGEVYWACYQYQQGLMQLNGDEHLSPVVGIQPVVGQWHVCGSGWDEYQAELAGQLSVTLASSHLGQLPQAQDIAQLAVAVFAAGSAVEAEQALPVYLRDDVAWKKVSQQN